MPTGTGAISDVAATRSEGAVPLRVRVPGPERIRFQKDLRDRFAEVVASTRPVRLCVAGPAGCGQGLTARLLAERRAALSDGKVSPPGVLVRVVPADLSTSVASEALERLRSLYASAAGGVFYLAELESLFADPHAVPLLGALRECLRDRSDVDVVVSGDADAVARLHALNPELFTWFTHAQVRSFTLDELTLILEGELGAAGVALAPGFAADARDVLRRIRMVGTLRNGRVTRALYDLAVRSRPEGLLLLSRLDLSGFRLLSGVESDGFTELDELIGLQGIKQTVRLWVANSELSQRRERLGLYTAGMGQHMVFKGPAGTAKTTVARIVGKVLAETGVLASGHLIEVQRADLVGETLEQSARRTVEAVKRAIGGVLFVDEAYTLTSTETGRDSGKEIVDTLLKLMEDYREEFVVIVAGYPLEMEQFLNSNPGLRSRFVRVLEFPSYSSGELLDILEFLAAKRGYQIGAGVREMLTPRLELVSNYPGFGNGRHVRNQLEGAIVRQATRVTVDSSDEDLRTLTVDDFPDPTAVTSLL